MKSIILISLTIFCFSSSLSSKCYVSYSPKEYKDLPTVHIFLEYPNSDYYVGYTIANRYDTTQTVYNNHFEIYDAFEYKFDGQKMTKTGNQIILNVESEFALLIKGRADYTGGVHGDEQYVNIKYFVDGKLKEFTKTENLIPCNEFSYVQESTLHESPTKMNGIVTANPLHPVEALHFKKTTFKNTGYQTFNRVTWEKSLEVSHWFFGICCVHKDNAMNFHNDLDKIEYKATSSGEFIMKDVIGAKTVFYTNDEKRLSSVVTSALLLPKNQEQNCKLMVWDRDNDTKYYRGYYPTSKVTLDEIWEGVMTVNHFRK
ncbi:MAG: hypothetical protein GZ091_08300 [Paludibacter sp.]|nr:hypothetical protein [Paludibacter sp.]